jgi:hypothetical protein
MKWLIFALFAVALLSSLLWHESGERKLTSWQATTFGAIALTGWALVVVLSVTIL